MVQVACEARLSFKPWEVAHFSNTFHVLATSPENAPLMPEKEHHAFSWIVTPLEACPFLRDVAYFYRFCVFYAMYHPLLCLAEASRLGRGEKRLLQYKHEPL